MIRVRAPAGASETVICKLMTLNVFDYLEELTTLDGDEPRWAARAPRRPRDDYDLKLLPRSPQWEQDGDSLLALEQVRREPWWRLWRAASTAYECAWPTAGSR